MPPSREPVFRAVGFGDPHLALPAPGYRDPSSFASETESLIEQFMGIAEAAKADAVFCPGDWFHLKGTTSHETVRWAVDLLRPVVKRYGPILTVPGNHDMVGNNLADAANRQPIAVLEAAGMIRRVDLNPYVVEKHGQKFGVFGTPYPHIGFKMPDNKGYPLLRLMHADLGTLNATGGYTGKDLAAIGNILSGSDRVVVHVNGHVHCPVAECWRNEMNPDVRAATRWFVPLGTLTRLSRPEADYEPRVAVITMTQSGARCSFQTIEPQHRGARAFVPDAVAPAAVASSASLKDFADHLSKHGDDAVDPAKLLADFAAKHKYSLRAVRLAQGFIESSVR